MITLTEDFILDRIIQRKYFVYEPEYWCDENDRVIHQMERDEIIIDEETANAPDKCKMNSGYTFIYKENEK